jgi:hypothetical protein
MFTEDYLMRIINQALAVLLTAVGLKKAGKHREARQAIDQAIEWLTSMPADLVDQMDDDGILSLLTVQERLDVERLATLADLFWEQGDNLLKLGQAAQGTAACARALRFTLEATLAGEGDLSPENIGKIETRRRALKQDDLPVETRVALLDYFQRLLAKDDGTLTAGGIPRKRAAASLAKLQDELGPYLKPNNE